MWVGVCVCMGGIWDRVCGWVCFGFVGIVVGGLVVVWVSFVRVCGWGMCGCSYCQIFKYWINTYLYKRM